LFEIGSKLKRARNKTPHKRMPFAHFFRRVRKRRNNPRTNTPRQRVTGSKSGVMIFFNKNMKKTKMGGYEIGKVGNTRKKS